MGAYLTPEVLVINRATFFGCAIVPRSCVIEIGAREDRLPTRAAISITAWTPREKRSTKNYGSFDLPRAELDTLLQSWWQGEPGQEPGVDPLAAEA